MLILYLTSSPCVIGADRALLTSENQFCRLLLQDIPSNSNCLYIASSPDDSSANMRFNSEIFSAFCEADCLFREMRVLQRANMDDAESLIRWSDFIILAGGHVPTQNSFFRDIQLGKLLKDYPGIIMGISAGTMNCAAMVYAQPELPGESSDPDYQRFIPGLGLTFLNILPHYQQVKDDILDGRRLYEDITYADSYGNRFLVLPDGSYVRVHNGESRLYGEAWLLEDGVMNRICRNGETVLL